MTSYIPGGSSPGIKPTATATALEFVNATERTEGWVLATAGINNNGPLCVQLVDENNRELSSVAEFHSSGGSQLAKFTRINIPATAIPRIVRVRATNKSSAPYSVAFVHGIFFQ